MAVCGGTARAGGQSAVLGGLQSACRRAGWATHVQRPRRLVSPAAPGAVGGRSAARRRPWVCRKECSDNECSLSPQRCAGRQAGRPARAHTCARTAAAPRWQPAGCEQSRASLPALGAADAAPCATPTSRPGKDRTRGATNGFVRPRDQTCAWKCSTNNVARRRERVQPLPPRSLSRIGCWCESRGVQAVLWRHEHGRGGGGGDSVQRSRFRWRLLCAWRRLAHQNRGVVAPRRPQGCCVSFAGG